MPLARIWLKRDQDFIFVAEGEVILEEDDVVGHIVLEADQLVVLRERIDDALKEEEM